MATQLFDELKISLASADQIRAWSYGEVKKPETINYRTLRPEKEGLFDERIFGPQRLGVLLRKRIAKGIICERCGSVALEVRRSDGPHGLAPVTHIWFFRCPSRLGYLSTCPPRTSRRSSASPPT